MSTPRIGALAVTADDVTLGPITRLGKIYAYTGSGARVPLASYLDTWAAL